MLNIVVDAAKEVAKEFLKDKILYEQLNNLEVQESISYQFKDEVYPILEETEGIENITNYLNDINSDEVLSHNIMIDKESMTLTISVITNNNTTDILAIQLLYENYKTHETEEYQKVLI